jgi:hypothetical protein
MKKNIAMCIIMGVLMIIFIIMGAFTLSCTIPVEKSWQFYKEIQIVSLRTADGVSGNFLSFSTDDYYHFAKINTDGSISMSKVSNKYEDIRIIEEDRKDGVVVYEKFSPVVKDDSHDIRYDNTRIIFRIPKGSIVREFSIK